MKNESEYLERVGLLIAAHPRAEIKPETLTIYARALSELPLDILDTVIMQCIRDYKFFPSIAEICAMADELMTPEYITAAAAWGKLNETIVRVGYYRTPEFDDPILAEVAGYMGWKYLCSSETQMPDRAHFMQMYEQVLNRKKHDAKLLPASRALKESNGTKQLRDGIKQLTTKMRMDDDETS